MGREQYCRENIDKVAEACGLEERTVSDVKRAAKFCASHREFSRTKTKPIITLISVKDEQVRNHAISLAKIALNQETPTGGKVKEKLTDPEVRKIIQKSELEIRGELTEKYRKEAPEKPAPDHIVDANKKVGKPTHAFTELHDGKPVPEPKTVSQIDQEQVRRDEIAEAARNQPTVHKEDSVPETAESGTQLPAWTIDLCKSGKCPDDRRHLVHEPMRGNVCDAAGAPINQLTKCPVVERMKRAAAEGPGTGFVRASGAPDYDPHTGGKIIKPGGIRIVKTPLTADELRARADDLIERSGFFTPKEVGLVDELVRAGHEGIHSRADFIKVSCNWFLTSAGGE